MTSNTNNDTPQPANGPRDAPFIVIDGSSRPCYGRDIRAPTFRSADLWPAPAFRNAQAPPTYLGTLRKGPDAPMPVLMDRARTPEATKYVKRWLQECQRRRSRLRRLQARVKAVSQWLHHHATRLAGGV